MMRHPALFPAIKADQVRAFSADGRLYRAFDHIIAAKPGATLLVPMYLVHGSLAGLLVDGCPVPWEEVDDVLHLEVCASYPFDFNDELYSDHMHAMADLVPKDWVLDFIHINRHPTAKAWRLQHSSGIRFAVSADLVYRESENHG